MRIVHGRDGVHDVAADVNRLSFAQNHALIVNQVFGAAFLDDINFTFRMPVPADMFHEHLAGFHIVNADGIVTVFMFDDFL